MRALQLDRRAKAELRKAIRDYMERDPELAQAFVREYIERVRFIVRFPEAGQRIPKHTTILVQRYLMKKRFPFKLITATRGDRMKILAIAPGHVDSSTIDVPPACDEPPPQPNEISADAANAASRDRRLPRIPCVPSSIALQRPEVDLR